MVDVDVPTITVTELTRSIKQVLEEGFPFFSVTGEISNFRPASSGHWFFTLKDEGAQISCVIFRSNAWKTTFTPQDGDKVTITGSLDLYPPRGTYQIICETIVKTGFGNLLAILEERKVRYQQKGYFDRKRPLPKNPTKLGIITSETGAALQDVLSVLRRRAPSLKILLFPSLVQGAEAAQSIAFRIEQANLLSDCDVLLITRGGGSIEDLLPFSEEVVLEAIHESTIPTVSAIGHEIDWALSDFVADLRAPTPSAAAELISKGIYDSKTELVRLRQQLVAAIEHQLLRAEMVVGKVSIPSLKAYLLTQVDRRQFRLANAQLALSNGIDDQLARRRNKLTLLSNQLSALSPLAILERGFALVSTKEGAVLRSSKPVREGDRLKIRWIDGERSVRVEEQDEL
ncbi:MAG: exodeoxyribonuclease VII large subunit [Spirochaetales bacterium]|nr:exodeoxyribonuclease VII large subunit [Spirochaetales bacterium]